MATPRSVVVVRLSLVFNGVDLLFRFAESVLLRDGALFLVLGSAIVSLAFFALVVFAVKRGWRAAPVLVTLVAIWAIGELSWGDALAVISVLVGALMAVAVWLPASRRYGSELRRTRLEAAGVGAAD